MIALGVILGVIAAYLLGSMPFGFWFARARGTDITKVGSGNIGATNVLRALGPRAAIPVLLLDASKGYVGAWFGQTLARALGGSPELGAVLGGIAAIAGHNWSVFLRLRGGKGVAAAAGAAVFLLPGPIALGVGVFLACVVLTRYVSLGSVLGALTVGAAALVGQFPVERKAFAVFAVVMIVLKHRPNIQRLLSGKESKIGERVS